MTRRIILAKDKDRAAKLKALYQSKKKELNLNQTTLADQLDMTQGAVSQFMNALVPLNTDAILKFAKVLDELPTAIDPDLDKLLKTKKTTIRKVPIIATLSGNRPAENLISLWVNSTIDYPVAIEADTDFGGEAHVGDYLIINPESNPRKGSKVIFRTKRKSAYSIGKLLGQTEDTLEIQVAGLIEQIKNKDISYLAKIAQTSTK